VPSLMSACAAANARKGYFRAFSPWRDGALGAHTPRAFAARPISRRNWRGRAAPILMPRLPEARERQDYDLLVALRTREGAVGLQKRRPEAAL
jgi:hypothetical protein